MAGRRWLLAVAFCAALALAPRVSAQQTAVVPVALSPTVSDIRIGRDGTNTRIVLELSAETEFIHDLSPDQKAVFIAFPDIRWTVPRTYRRTQGIITGYTFRRNDRGGGSLVLSTADPVRVDRISVRPPSHGHGHRIILVLADADVVVPRTEAELTAAVATAKGEPAGGEGPRAMALLTFPGKADLSLRAIAAGFGGAIKNRAEQATPSARLAAEARRQAAQAGRQEDDADAAAEPAADPEPWKPRLERFGAGPPSDKPEEAPVLRAPTREENQAI